MSLKFHPYHMISLRPWPVAAALGIWGLVSLSVITFSLKSLRLLFIVLPLIIAISWFWWTDVVKESLSEGFHHRVVTEGLKAGILLFIASEVLFFVSFFWAYFHSSISPCIDIGQVWPPLIIESFNPINVPLLNTLILLSSGVSVTWRHHSMIEGDKKTSVLSLALTCVLGVYFTFLQGLEYVQATFTIRDSSYGSTFFVATGFHGIHVLIGRSFLLVCLVREIFLHVNKNHLLGFELAAWYWHFVDVVWLFLYTSIYWWGA